MLFVVAEVSFTSLRANSGTSKTLKSHLLSTFEADVFLIGSF